MGDRVYQYYCPGCERRVRPHIGTGTYQSHGCCVGKVNVWTCFNCGIDYCHRCVLIQDAGVARATGHPPVHTPRKDVPVGERDQLPIDDRGAYI